ncbi:hypothetical protein WA171_004365 [Blastocystis sp. BT1]
MDSDSDTPVGVKMLADHLVKVKLQYEERINEMIVHMRTVEKEKEEMRKKYKQMEDELELRRQEIFQMKRESSTQYVMEERENWKAVMAQQQQVISKLEKDLAISQERSSALQQQLDTLEIKEEPKIADEEVDSQSLSMGPPQPQSPPSQDESSSDEFEKLKAELAETKQLNTRLTDQFIHRVDELEREHRERENMLLEAIEGLKKKLDLELEKKWELIQQLRDEENSHQGLISFLWG